MSTFATKSIACPACGVETPRDIAESLNAPRVPHVRQAILEDRFQRFTCPQCGKAHAVDMPLIYIDFAARHWIGMFPRAWETSWRSLESQSIASFRTNVVEHAPPMIQAQAPGFVVRTVFGLEALRDKLVCRDAGLDDSQLELLKLELMRSLPELVFHPQARPALWKVEPRSLVFTVAIPREQGVWERVLMTVERERLQQLADDPAFAAVRDELRAGPYVDVGRIMMPGGPAPHSVPGHADRSE